MSALNTPPAGASETAPSSQPRRRMFAWNPRGDTLIAAGTLLAFWGCYWAGNAVNEWFLLGGIVIVATLIPVVTVVLWRREGLAGLGIRRRLLIVSLIVSALLGAGSAYQLVTVAAASNVPVMPHLLANLVVFWEPFFVFGWLFLRWERAFGWLPAIVLTGVGFALQHVGSVPFVLALSFGLFAIAFGIVFVCVRNLAILWPLFYPVASGIGTLQSGFVMGWPAVISGTVLLIVQVIVIGGVVWLARRRTTERRV